MEKFVIEKDIPVMYVTADSFPDGIMAAHHTIHAIMTSPDRVFFGISFPDKNGVIAYKAGVERFSEEEALTLELETYIIRKGNYESVFLKEYYKKPERIAEAFQQLLTSPDLDPKGACVEMYKGEKDVRCMVKLK